MNEINFLEHYGPDWRNSNYCPDKREAAHEIAEHSENGIEVTAYKFKRSETVKISKSQISKKKINGVLELAQKFGEYDTHYIWKYVISIKAF